MILHEFSSEEWKQWSQTAHASCFGETRDPLLDRIDYALVTFEGCTPMAYSTIREVDAETAYMQYGGAFPDGRGIKAVKSYALMMDHLASKYKRATTLIENTNTPMLKLAMNEGWLIKGLRVFGSSILLEHQKEFGG